MQVEITRSADLLNEKGELSHPGWAKELLLRYDRSAIKKSKLRIKEWDYYCILTANHGIALTVADNGYMGIASATLFDFSVPREITNSIFTFFPLGSFNMPSSSKDGDVHFESKSRAFHFIRKPEKRILTLNYPDFAEKKDLTCSVTLTQPDSLQSMVIATPFKEDRNAFYYNQKVNCMPAEGEIRFGDSVFHFHPSSSFGVLDWGRGVWTYSNTWYWGSASGLLEDIPFGFNIGYGFGDTTKATENMLFYNEKANKLDRIEFHIPPDYLKPWTFTSSDHRFEMEFKPLLDRSANINLILLKSVQHQVFGYFSGKAVLDDGKEIILNNFLGFAEKVENKW
ncbi:MAG: DUF2804 domain-containing protein [Bacillota bacterium]